MAAAARKEGFGVFFPPPEFCTDNAVMIASAGAHLIGRGVRGDLHLTCFSRVPLSEIPWMRGRVD
jgi:N6-L-threonylcarbamoyladenine synthase